MTNKTPFTKKIILKEGQKYLSETGLKELPFGLINKNHTGIGATTVEILADRCSVIISPTIVLAETKAIDSEKKYSKSHTNYKFFYYGSSPVNSKIKKPDFIEIEEAMIKDEKNVKIFAVADSYIDLHELLKHADLLQYFFVLFDEIDTFQSESIYRDKLEGCFEKYFDLDQKMRATISATIEDSVYIKLLKEPRTEIVKESVELKKITYINAINNIAKVASTAICELNNGDIKLLIALDSISEQRRIIELLPESMKSSISILCSSYEESIRKAGDYYNLLKAGKLPSKINFITSAYFVGIDIFDQAHIVLISSPSRFMLTGPKIIQIIGRIRNYQDKLDIKFISQFSNQAAPQVETVKEKLVRRYISVRDNYNKLLKTNTENQIIFSNEYIENHLRLEKDKISDSQMMRLKIIDGKPQVVIYRFKIDHILQKAAAKYYIYSDFNRLIKYFNKYFLIDYSEDRSDLSQDEKQNIEKVDKQIKSEKVIIFINEYKPGVTIPINKNISNYKLFNILEKTIEMSNNFNIEMDDKLIPFKQLLINYFKANEINNHSSQKFTKYYSRLYFYFHKESKVIEKLKKEFQIDNNYSRIEVIHKIDKIFRYLKQEEKIIFTQNIGLKKPKELSERICLAILNNFFETNRYGKTKDMIKIISEKVYKI